MTKHKIRLLIDIGFHMHISATAHDIDNWNLQSRIPFTSKFDGHLCKT